MTDTPAPNDMPDLLPVKLETDDIGLYIYATMSDGSRNTVFDIRVRGWGNLTGGGARNLDPKFAEKVQVMWAQEMCRRYNTFEAERAAHAAGGGALNWKRQKDTVFAWAAEHGFTPVESEIVDLLSALQQPPAPAVDLESLYKGNRHNETDYNQGWNDCIDHLAAQGMIKGVE